MVRRVVGPFVIRASDVPGCVRLKRNAVKDLDNSKVENRLVGRANPGTGIPNSTRCRRGRKRASPVPSVAFRYIRQLTIRMAPVAPLRGEMSQARKRSRSFARFCAAIVLVLAATACADKILELVTGLTPTAPTVTPATATLRVGQTVSLVASAQVGAEDIVWTSSSNAIAMVSSTGVVTAVAVGSAVITATRSGLTGTSSITVIP